MKTTRQGKSGAGAPSAEAQVSLTLDQRDAVDLAKSRLRGCVTLLFRAVDHHNFQTHDTEDHEAIGCLIDDMRAAIETIDDTFKAADGDLTALDTDHPGARRR